MPTPYIPPTLTPTQIENRAKFAAGKFIDGFTKFFDNQAVVNSPDYRQIFRPIIAQKAYELMGYETFNPEDNIVVLSPETSNYLKNNVGGYKDAGMLIRELSQATADKTTGRPSIWAGVDADMQTAFYSQDYKTNNSGATYGDKYNNSLPTGSYGGGGAYSAGMAEIERQKAAGTYVDYSGMNQRRPGGSWGDGGSSNFLSISDLGSSISNLAGSAGKSVENAVTSVGNTLEAIAQNPLPVIETIALVILAPEIAVAMGVSTAVVMAVGSVAISAANGETNPEKLAVTAITSYVGSQVSQYASETITSNLPTDIQNLPSSTNTFLIKTASSAVGADAAATTGALLNGNNLEDSLQKGSDAAAQSLAVSLGKLAGSEVASNIEDPTLAKLAGGATAGGTTAALTGQDIVQGASSGLAQTAGKEAGSFVASNIEDPTLSKIAGGAVSGGVTAGLRGQDVIEGAQAGATQPLLDAAGNLLDQYGPKFSGDSGIDLSGIKDAATAVLQPISDAATKVLQPLEQPVKDVVQAGADTATKVLQPLEQPIKDVAQAGSDVATTVLQPLEQPVKDVLQATSDAATTVLQPLEQPVKDVLQAGSDLATRVLQPLEQPIKDVGTSIVNAARDITSDLPNVTIPKIDRDVMQAIANQYSSSPQGPSDLTSPSIATTGSPASYAGEDIAILGDAPGSLGSKVSKKGGKYPWGDPEGTTALKEGLGV